MTGKQTYSLADIAKRWGWSYSSVRRLVKSGQLPAIDVATKPQRRSYYRVLAKSLNAFEVKHGRRCR